MARGNDADAARRSRATRSAGLLPLVIGVASAVALTGAAFFTVDSASCGSPAQYIRHDSHVELVGGCVDGATLPATGTPKSGGVVHGNYNP
ncbi:hypothetical protein ABZ342_34260 [Amycolatopsis sp. NPDC005961]|uniref:Uncharacterized protein n=1 Tax=Amycolatopsis camponoti TaxID=2606593 RepID=A0A6I8LF77_9PSEU|nr:hypothetical protein [Amycolatopsis camponoti]VVJ15510.1 Uncharacterised protein [Amycolatopsis camponoti]